MLWKIGAEWRSAIWNVIWNNLPLKFFVLHRVPGSCSLDATRDWPLTRWRKIQPLYLAPAGISASPHRYPKVMPRVAFHFLSRFPIKTNCPKPAYFSVFAKIYEGRLRLWSVGIGREGRGKNGCKTGTVGITRHLSCWSLYMLDRYFYTAWRSRLFVQSFTASPGNRSSSPDDGAGRDDVMKTRARKALRVSSFVRT